MPISTTIFIYQLPQDTQDKIKKDLKRFFYKNYGTKKQVEQWFGISYHDIIENGMSGRLCDLEENLNIKKYI